MKPKFSKPPCETQSRLNKFMEMPFIEDYENEIINKCNNNHTSKEIAIIMSFYFPISITIK